MISAGGAIMKEIKVNEKNIVTTLLDIAEQIVSFCSIVLAIGAIKDKSGRKPKLIAMGACMLLAPLIGVVSGLYRCNTEDEQ